MSNIDSHVSRTPKSEPCSRATWGFVLAVVDNIWANCVGDDSQSAGRHGHIPAVGGVQQSAIRESQVCDQRTRFSPLFGTLSGVSTKRARSVPAKWEGGIERCCATKLLSYWIDNLCNRRADNIVVCSILWAGRIEECRRLLMKAESICFISRLSLDGSC